MSDSNTADVRTGCEWQADIDGVWSTSCGKDFVLNDGGPIENEMRFCCYCGLSLDELPYEEPEDDENDGICCPRALETGGLQHTADCGREPT